jgi:hypothetical protein
MNHWDIITENISLLINIIPTQDALRLINLHGLVTQGPYLMFMGREALQMQTW